MVDDSEIIRRRLSVLINRIEGVSIAGEAEDTEKAIQLFSSTRPDTVILDLKIPRDGGFHVLEVIKKKNPGTTVIILTNYYDDAYRYHCFQIGADYFLDKSKDFYKIESILVDQ